jgi:integrase
LGAAKAFAQDWFFKKQTEIASGEISSPKYQFDAVEKLAIKHYNSLVERGLRSAKTLEGIQSILKTRVTPYFKKMSVSSIDNTAWQRFKDKMVEKYPKITRGTLHQYKNAVRTVLNEAFRQGYIKQLPVFKDEYNTKKNEMSRPWFNPTEYRRLHRSIAAHANYLKKRDKLQFQHAMELYDYVMIATNTGMRVGELRNCKISDIRVEVEKDTGKEYLVIRNIVGKRGTGTCQSYYGAVAPYKRVMERRKISKPHECEELLFLIHHRVMFNKILEKRGLKYSKTTPPAKRDFVSLRATYICFRLMNGVPVYDVAKNCRTSVAMIEQAYTKHLSGLSLTGINRTLGWDY